MVGPGVELSESSTPCVTTGSKSIRRQLEVVDTRRFEFFDFERTGYGVGYDDLGKYAVVLLQPE